MQLTVSDEARNLKCIIVKKWVDSLCMYLLAYVWQEGLELLFLFTENINWRWVSAFITTNTYLFSCILSNFSTIQNIFSLCQGGQLAAIKLEAKAAELIARQVKLIVSRQATWKLEYIDPLVN